MPYKPDLEHSRAFGIVSVTKSRVPKRFNRFDLATYPPEVGFLHASIGKMGPEEFLTAWSESFPCHWMMLNPWRIIGLARVEFPRYEFLGNGQTLAHPEISYTLQDLELPEIGIPALTLAESKAKFMLFQALTQGFIGAML